jgi:hypothetical protein
MGAFKKASTTTPSSKTETSLELLGFAFDDPVPILSR